MTLQRFGIASATRILVATIWSLLMLLGPAAPVWALNASDLPPAPPANHVLDQAQLLSRASAADISKSLEALSQQQLQASWVSVPRLDYDLSLAQFGQELLDRWTGSGSDQLLLLIDGQTSATAIVASPALQQRLSPELLRSTSRTTMTQPLREGNRYRQASLDAINRLSIVLDGGDDPGEPAQAVNPVATARVPSREQTLSSNATTWVIVLLVVGTLVPMLTWWVFSR
ncbi:MAG: TPM domain-containing protein [Cyanobacteria bacterium K_Offshore_0m_m2_072]|nr:TPM domain-containing protein [Cyanobacteria bacterium K_Offshore_0m_m2_072]